MDIFIYTYIYYYTVLYSMMIVLLLFDIYFWNWRFVLTLTTCVARVLAVCSYSARSLLWQQSLYSSSQLNYA